MNAPTRQLRGKRAHGQAMVEFAFTSLIFITTLLTIFEGGRFMVDYADMAYAVQEGGRSAALPPTSVAPVGGIDTTTQVCNAVAKASHVISINCSVVIYSGTTTTTKTFSARTTGDRAEVTGTYTFIPVLSSIFGGSTSKTITYTAVFTVE